MHLINDPRSFWYHRLNPLWGRPLVEVSTGRDFYGRKVGVIDAAKDVLRSWIPIPMQGIVKDNLGDTIYDATINSLLQSVGLSNYPYQSDAVKKARELSGAHIVAQGTKEQVEKSKVKRELVDDYRKDPVETTNKLRQMIKDKKITTDEALDIQKKGKEPPLIGYIRHLTVPELLQVWDKTNNDEKKILKPIITSKWYNWQAPLTEKREFYDKFKEVRAFKGPALCQ